MTHGNVIFEILEYSTFQKKIAYVESFDHILFNLIFNVNSNLAESSANCSDTESLDGYKIFDYALK